MGNIFPPQIFGQQRLCIPSLSSPFFLDLLIVAIMFYFFPFVFGVFLIIYIFPVFVFANTNVAAGSFRDKSRGTKHCKTNLNFMKHFIYILNLFRHSLTKFGQVGSRSHVKCLESDTLELKKGKVKSLIAKSRYFLNHFV